MNEQETNKMGMENLDKPRRRFVGLTVREVSLVDSGANEREFAIIKRKGGQEEMADEIKREKQPIDSAEVVKEEKPDNDTAEPTKDEAATTDTAVEEAKDGEAQAESAEVTKLAEQVQVLLSKVEGLEKAGNGGGKSTDADTTKAGAGMGLKMIANSIRGALDKLKKGDAKGAMVDLEQCLTTLGNYSADGGGGGYPVAAKKAEEVEKAGAKMSKARVEKLDNIFKTIETAFTTLKELMADVQGSVDDTKKEATTDTKKAAIIEVDGDKVAEQIKTVVEPVTKALEGFTEQIKGLTGRVESIEKARGVSKGSDDGQEDVTKQKGNGFWAGTAVAGVGAKAQQ